MSLLDFGIAIVGGVAAFALARSLAPEEDTVSPIIVTAGTLVLLGTVLPWAEFGTYDWVLGQADQPAIGPYSGGGTVGSFSSIWLSAFASGIVLALGVTRHRSAAAIAAVFGGLVALAALPDVITTLTTGSVDYIEVSEIRRSVAIENTTVGPGAGLLATFTGGVLAVIASYYEHHTVDYSNVDSTVHASTDAEPATEGTDAEPATEGTDAEPATEGTDAEPATERTDVESSTRGSETTAARSDTSTE